MHYEIRLKFINYIKEKFDLRNTPNYATILFYFDDYENFDEIRVKINPTIEELHTYHRQRCDQEFGSCIVYKKSQEDNLLFFDDAYLMYHENVFLNECMLNIIRYDCRNDMTMQDELNELVLLLQGKHNTQRISNC